MKLILPPAHNAILYLVLFFASSLVTWAQSISQPSTNTNGSGESTSSPNAADSISGTVLDKNGDLLQGATVVLDGITPDDHRELTANSDGLFVFDSLKSDTPYRVKVFADGFSEWDSKGIILQRGQALILTGIVLQVATKETSITVYGDTEKIATQQVYLEEKQRILGIIPNFYVVYDAQNAVPMTTKLKFKLALKVSTDAITISGVALMAGINQAADTPNYVQGAKGFSQRFGAQAADGVTDIMFGGAILPSLLHQDPRYFYQGTGTAKSRMRHAMLSPFWCRTDSGNMQINYSSIGGDLIASSMSNAYYPNSNRGPSLVFGNFAISTAERMLSSLAQEFVLPRFTTHPLR